MRELLAHHALTTAWKSETVHLELGHIVYRHKKSVVICPNHICTSQSTRYSHSCDGNPDCVYNHSRISIKLAIASHKCGYWWFFFSSSQSYWDWLPTEIQAHILSFVWWQSVRDQRNPLKENLFREISNYHALKVAWNQPPVARDRIHITHRRCVKRCPNNINMDLPGYSLYCDGKSCTMTHSCIWGIYTMQKIGQYKVFMG